MSLLTLHIENDVCRVAGSLSIARPALVGSRVLSLDSFYREPRFVLRYDGSIGRNVELIPEDLMFSWAKYQKQSTSWFEKKKKKRHDATNHFPSPRNRTSRTGLKSSSRLLHKSMMNRYHIPQCSRNENMCVHFCYKMVHCGICLIVNCGNCDMIQILTTFWEYYHRALSCSILKSSHLQSHCWLRGPC